jgi:hypothetical protein
MAIRTFADATSYNPSGPSYDPTGAAVIMPVTPEKRMSSHTQGLQLRAYDHQYGYMPQWGWRQPPGVGDAPQFVWETYCLAPVSVDGPGDRPVSFLRSTLAPILQTLAVTYSGTPIFAGNMLLNGLYTPTPMGSPNNLVFSGNSGPA